MISWRRFLSASSSVVAASAVLAGPAAAHPPATGTYTDSGGSGFSFIGDTNGVNYYVSPPGGTTAYSGGLTGDATGSATLGVFPDGSVVGSGVEVCDLCTIGGRTGGYTAVESFTIAPGSTLINGHERFVGGFGGLAGLRGGGTFQRDENSSTGTYSYSYHFRKKAAPSYVDPFAAKRKL